MQGVTNGGNRSFTLSDDLLLRETNHRCSNDLQLVIGLLALQSSRSTNPEVRQALNDATERVSVLARARRGLHDEPQELNSALQQICEALHAQAEPRLIAVAYTPGGDLKGLSPGCVTTLALVVNELATNAIKHAFEEGKAGSVHVSASTNGRDVSVIVDDDGLPFPSQGSEGTGIGMGLAKRMMASIDGLLILPGAASKLFELRVPVR